MPPLPVDCSEYPRIKSSRTKLNFTVEKREMNDLCREDGKPSVMSCNMNILVDENSQKYMNGVSGHNKRSSPFSESTPTQKRPRYNFYTSTPKSNILSTPKKTTKPNFFTSTPKPVLKESSDSGNRSPVSAIIEAVDRLSTKADVTADGSRDNTLPTIPGKHRDLKSIKPETMSDVLDGAYNDSMGSLTVIDCRYPYEFDGGHIKGAINLYTKDMIEKFLKETRVTPNKTQVIIFHCEFSSERGPKMFRFLRSLDREINKDNYPRLNFPEVYLLEGGYKAFFYQNKEQCYPQTYKPMLHKDHKDDLRHFRVKSKSWSAGEKSRPRHSLGSGMRLRF